MRSETEGRGDGASGPTEEFVELVRDGLLRLFDQTYLQTHPLLGAMADIASTAGMTRGKLLCQALLGAIEALRPAPGVPGTSRVWRTYRMLELRYVEGQDVAEVADQIGISKTHYHREHHRAIQAVASVLWDRWQLAGRWIAGAESGHSGNPAEEQHLAQLEVESLTLSEGKGRVDLSEVLLGISSLLRPLCVERGVDLQIDLPERLPSIPGERVALRQALLGVLWPSVSKSDGDAVQITAVTEGCRVKLIISGRSTEGLQAGRPDCPDIEEIRPFVEALKGSLTHVESVGQLCSWALMLSFPSTERPLLLVVDNNADFIHLVERYLIDQDWEVVGVTNAREAYAVAQDQHPAAVLLDIVLPGRDGWEVLQDLRNSPSTKGIPVVVCSVLSEPGIARSLGASAYLHKPIDQRRLLKTLDSITSAADR